MFKLGLAINMVAETFNPESKAERTLEIILLIMYFINTGTNMKRVKL